MEPDQPPQPISPKAITTAWLSAAPLGLAWLLFGISLFIPQAGCGRHCISPGSNEVISASGLALILALLVPGIVFLAMASTLNVGFFAPAVFISALLFAASPVLWFWVTPPPSHRRAMWLGYSVLNVLGVVLFLLGIRATHIVYQIDPAVAQVRLLPGVVIWTAAQATLTVAALAKRAGF